MRFRAFDFAPLRTPVAQCVCSQLHSFFSIKAPQPAAQQPCGEDVLSSLLRFPTLALFSSPPF